MDSKNQISSFILILVVILNLGFHSSCSNSNNRTETVPLTNVQAPMDSTQKVLIETMVNSINEGLREQGLPKKLAFPLKSPADTISYWQVDDQSARISFYMNPSQFVYWPTFFVYEGELVFVRYRFLSESPSDNWASECMIYLQNGNIVYCEERRMDLQNGEFAGRLRNKPFSLSTRTKEEIEKDYKDSWKAVADFMNQQKVFPFKLAY